MPPRSVSASEVAEYAYCPRALYYHRRFPDAPATPSEQAGRRYHDRSLTAERVRSGRAALYWAGLGVGGLLLLIAAAAGGVL